MEARVMTPFTYFSLPMQKQFLANQRAIQGKPYADFFPLEDQRAAQCRRKDTARPHALG